MRTLAITLLLLLATGLIVSVGCFVPGETTCGQETGEPTKLTGKVVYAYVVDDAGAKTPVEAGPPVENAHVFVELCKLYSENPDPSKGHPNYRYATTTKADGTYEVMVPAGAAGLHVFLPGHRYGFDRIADVSRPAGEIRLVDFLAGDTAPVVSNFVVSPTEVIAGGALRFSVDVRAGRPTDLLSEEVLLLEVGTGRGRAMAPPSRGIQGKGFPNGKWTLTLDAPTKAGTYDYWVSVSSEQCITSDRLKATVTVR